MKVVKKLWTFLLTFCFIFSNASTVEAALPSEEEISFSSEEENDLLSEEEDLSNEEENLSNEEENLLTEEERLDSCCVLIVEKIHGVNGLENQLLSIIRSKILPKRICKKIENVLEFLMNARSDFFSFVDSFSLAEEQSLVECCDYLNTVIDTVKKAIKLAEKIIRKVNEKILTQIQQSIILTGTSNQQLPMNFLN